MREPDKIDYAKLLGFDAVCDQLSGRIDFQDVAIDSKLGAKVGTEACIEPAPGSTEPRPGSST
jgi:hypothetical protein